MTASSPDAIPVYIGDDWSFAFTYRESGGNGAPVDLTGCVIAGELYSPSNPTPTQLTMAGGQAGIVDAAGGRLALGAPRSLTASFKPGSLGGLLHILLVEAGLVRTIAVWPLVVLTGQDSTTIATLVARTVTDPVSHRVLTFDGLTDQFPVVAGSGGSLDFSTPDNSGLTVALGAA